MSDKTYYDISISFTETHRPVAEAITKKLENKGLNVYYYPHKISDDIGTDMQERLPYIYQYQSKQSIALLSKEYFNKQWTQIEWKAIQARAVKEKEEYGNQSKFLIPIMMENFEHEEISSSIVHYKWNGDVERFSEQISNLFEAPKKEDNQSISVNNINSTIENQFNIKSIKNLNIN